ncbi:MAG: hypothetical protein H6Q86_1581, partial [candidate division NC10 bacterium]|nr:hypothetical protein [candidate division NC10 bacterium]
MVHIISAYMANCFYPPTCEPGSVMVKAPQGWINILQKVSAIGMIATVFLLASVRLSSENQLVLCTGMLVLLCVAGWLRNAQPVWSRVGVIVIGTYVTLRYWVFRTTET